MSDPLRPYIRLPLSMGFSRQEYWSGLPCLPPGDLSDSGIELASLRSLAMTSGFITPSATREAWTSPSVQFSRSVVSDSLRPHESKQARAEQNMAACFIRASEQRGEGGWGMGAGRSHHPFTLILRHPTASVDHFSVLCLKF